jgi:putative DNA methylase
MVFVETGRFGKKMKVGGLHPSGPVTIRDVEPLGDLSRNEFSADWDPSKDKRIPAWELLHNLIRALNQQGTAAAGHLLRAVPRHERAVRQSAFRLYVHTEQAGRAAEALEYNKLISAWEDIRLAAAPSTDGEQGELKL